MAVVRRFCQSSGKAAFIHSWSCLYFSGLLARSSRSTRDNDQLPSRLAIWQEGGNVPGYSRPRWFATFWNSTMYLKMSCGPVASVSGPSSPRRELAEAHLGPVLMTAFAAAVRPPFVVELSALAGLVRRDHDLDVIERQKSLVRGLLQGGQGTEDDMVGLRRQLEADARLGAVGRRRSATVLGRRDDLSATRDALK